MIQKGGLAAVAVVLAVAMVFAMTAAWYSNVIQTTGLIFNVSEWGLESGVNIENELKNAAPGESGKIALEVHNSSDGIIDVNLNIDKVGLYNDIGDMRKRLYFYIDDTAQRNDETVNRVYLNSEEEYSYTVLAKQKLILGEQGNNFPLMWEWVYDVLGYYFYGTVTTSSTAEIEEYLRPVIYDYDAATFSNGQLATVDGSTTATNFIAEITANDGYAGTTSRTVKSSDGKIYYPVEIDENGNGVWIYCCTLGEIQYENVVDTNLGNAEQDLRRFRTNLNVLAQQKKLTVATVNSVDEFKTALADDTHNMVVLSNDIVLSEKLTMAPGNEKIVDLATHTISTDLTGTLVDAKEGASFTLMNGAIKGNDSHSGTLFSIVGSDVALSGMTITDVAEVARIADNESSNNDTKMNIVDCTINCSTFGISIKGNGPISQGATYLNIENSEIISTGSFALVGNGSVLKNGNWGTNICVSGSTLKAKHSGIYHPQPDSVLLVKDSIIEGMTPFVVKGGTVTIEDTEIKATNDEGTQEEIQEPSLGVSGYADTGAALYVETGYNYLCDVTLIGTNKLTSYYSEAILLYMKDNENYSIKVSGGDYSHDVSEFLADGYVCKKNNENRYEVTAK